MRLRRKRINAHFNGARYRQVRYLRCTIPSHVRDSTSIKLTGSVGQCLEDDVVVWVGDDVVLDEGRSQNGVSVITVHQL